MTPHKRETDVVVIGGGPAGLAAAAAAAEAGAEVMLLDRNRELGGILNQCIHDGFGLHAFGEVLTGPEFAARYVDRAQEAGVRLQTETLVAELSEDHQLICTSPGSRVAMRGRSIVLAMGCRERTRGMLRIPGTRPAGVYTAGTAQWLTNMANIRVGQRVLILGSGDIGLIMARRLTWEGADVVGVVELLPYASGLPRNISQCLEDYGIPLYLSHSATHIHGRERVEAVTVAEFDAQRQPIPGTEFDIACDTLLLSVGLIPENELSRRAGVRLDDATCGAWIDDRYMTSVDGVFSCGNVLHIHDLADWAAEEGERAGRSAAAHAIGLGSPRESAPVPVDAGAGIRYVVPQTVARGTEEVLVSFRVVEPGTDRTAQILADGRVLAETKLRRAHPAEMVQIRADVPGGLDTATLEVRLS